MRVRCAYGVSSVCAVCARCTCDARAVCARCAHGARDAASGRRTSDARAMHASAMRVWRACSVFHFGLAHSDFAAKVCVCVPRCFVFPHLIFLSKYDVFFEVGCAMFHAQLRTQPLAYELNIARVT